MMMMRGFFWGKGRGGGRAAEAHNVLWLLQQYRDLAGRHKGAFGI